MRLSSEAWESTKQDDTCGVRTHAGRAHRLSRPAPQPLGQSVSVFDSYPYDFLPKQSFQPKCSTWRKGLRVASARRFTLSQNGYGVYSMCTYTVSPKQSSCRLVLQAFFSLLGFSSRGSLQGASSTVRHGPEKGSRVRISQKFYLEPKWLRCTQPMVASFHESRPK